MYREDYAKGGFVMLPLVDVVEVGAGGGSIAWIDEVGALKVGPQSAGADPGPAAYQRGGVQPTITDAQICLHRLNPVALLEGRLKVDEGAARKVITEKVAQPLGLALEAAAEGGHAAQVLFRSSTVGALHVVPRRLNAAVGAGAKRTSITG